MSEDAKLRRDTDAPPQTSTRRQAVAGALRALDVERLVLAIHDVSFPASDEHDLGVGSPYSAGGEGLFRFARDLGFTGVQLGPQGDTTPGNPSPYDSTLFSRSTLSLSLPPIPGEASPPHPEHADYAVAWPRQRARIAAAFARMDPASHFASVRWAKAQGPWLENEALYASLTEAFSTDDWRAWPHETLPDPALARIVHDRCVYTQWLAAEQHTRLRALCGELGLRLWGDLQVGVSHRDLWSMQPLFLDGYRMGAPPSRTTPAGQPWGFPVLDPAQLEGAAGALVEARIVKMLDEYDGLRIDHPHGLIDPWVYRTDRIVTHDDALAAVRAGGRLFSSPDLVDHPALSRWGITRTDQIDHDRDRWDDAWVNDLDDAQVARYAVLFDRVIACVKAKGLRVDDQLCEVLSTWPYPLRRVMQRHGLGRLVVTQKAKLDDPRDVYRTENAVAADWAMVGNHDTAPLWKVVDGWHGTAAGLARARYLAESLEPVPSLREAMAERIAATPSSLATAMFAALFACKARSVSVFFADLFGMRDSYNVPGSVSTENWRMRLPPDYAQKYAEALQAEAGPAALDLSRALLLALHARGITDPSVVSPLRDVAGR